MQICCHFFSVWKKTQIVTLRWQKDVQEQPMNHQDSSLPLTVHEKDVPPPKTTPSNFSDTNSCPQEQTKDLLEKPFMFR